MKGVFYRGNMSNERVYNYTFSSIYKNYVNKVERKDKPVEQLDALRKWLTDFNDNELAEHKQNNTTLREVFEAAPMNPSRKEIKGAVCGVRVEDIEEPLMQEIRYMDKLVDELARGKKFENISR